MPVVPLTLTISLCLVFTFIVFFLREHSRGRVSSAERDSLLPLSDEAPRLARMNTSTTKVGGTRGAGSDDSFSGA